MPDSVAIAGAGIIGLSIAWQLANSGTLITVFDAREAGGEASWAGAGMLSLGGEIEAGSEIASLAIESRALYPSFVRALESASGLSIDYQECGALDLAYSQEDWQELQARLYGQAPFELNHRVLNAQQIASFWPRVRREGLVAGLFYPGDGVVNPRELIAALKVACRRAGVSLCEGCPVQDIRVQRDSVSVKTERGEGDFAAAVVAAGAWSNTIRVTGTPELPFAEPVKGHLIGYLQPDQTCNTIIRHGHTYLLQRANGLLIVGASMEHVGFDRQVKPERVTELVRQAAEIMPHLAETSPTEVWTGFRPASTKLQLGAWGSPRLLLAYGHLRNGILLAPVTAQRIREELSASLRTHSFVADERPQ
ncbi:MAG: glycine oxidase ThiO [Acidobacteriaceae bacterium]|nr:glycine oxidase ThiO [Acidobacteriaceae bacterium]